MAILGGGDANNVQVKIKVSSDTAEVDKTRKALNAFEKDARDSGNGALSLSGAATAAKATLVGLGVGALAAGAATLQSAASFEQTRIGLENMLGSADSAKTLLGDVSKFAAETPFEFPELAGATKQLVAFGFTGDAAFETMKQLGDVSAAIGAPIGDLSYLMGTLRTQGRAFTVDIRQFAQRGVPIYEYLAKVLKTDEKSLSGMIEAGKVGFPEVQKAFQLMTGEGGKFHGAMEKQSRSLSGLFSTLKDNIGQAGREIIGINSQGDVAQGSIFDMMRNGASGLIAVLPGVITNLQQTIGQFAEVANQIGDYLGPKLGELITAIGENLGPILSDLWHNVIEPLIPVLGTVLVGALGLVIDATTLLVEGIGWLYQQFMDGNPIVLGLAGVFGTLAAAMAFNAVFNALTVGFNVLTLIEIPRVMASVSALSALIATPMIMPAIVVGAALAALALVYDSAIKTMQAVDAAVEAQDLASKSNADAIKRIQASNMSPEWKSKKIRAISAGGSSVPGFATGVRNFSGGLAVVGERGPEVIELPKGSSVNTNQQSKQMMTGTTVHNYFDNVNLTTAGAVREFFSMQDQDSRSVRDGLTPARGAN